MAENNTQDTTPETDVIEGVVVTPQTRLQAFVNRHPRAAKVIALTGGAAAVVGVACFGKTLHANRSHLNAAGDHAREALDELSTSVTPQSPEA